MSALADSFAGTARLRPAPRRGHDGPQRAPVASGPAAHPAWARLAAFAPLALLGTLGWARLVEPGASPGGWAAALAPAAGGALLLAGARGGMLRRGAVCLLVAALLAIGALLAAGVPLRLLPPAHWGALAAGIREGLGSMAGAAVPYAGVDPWVRTAILLCGWGLAAIAALLAFWPRRGRLPGRPLAAAVALGALYAVPVIERGAGRPYLDGAVFCVLLGGFLWLERLRRDQLAAGALCLVAVAALGAALAPRVAGGRPWIDYQHLAADVAGSDAETFSWDQTYRAFDWPRRGRVVARIKATVPEYWKVVNLDAFDGRAWVQDPQGDAAIGADSEHAPGHPAWHQTIRVIFGALRSRAFIGAGETERITQAPPAVRTSPGTFAAGGALLGRGASYIARVYVPRPGAAAMRAAGARYPGFLAPFLRMRLPSTAAGVAPVSVQFPPFHSGRPGQITLATGYSYESPAALDAVRGSPYGRMYALARRLARAAATPYDFLQSARRRVEQGAVYSEDPGSHRWPLDAFLFDARRGYCQQFSGAMALLLRMGGVPARVASGFAPGSYDASSGQWLVRDSDAHAWVEAYFPRIGWATFDPTPAAAPPQRESSAGASAGAPRPRPSQARRGTAPTGGGLAGVRAVARGGFPWALLAAIAIAAGILAAGIGLLVRRGRPPGPAPPRELAELVVALHRTGRTPPPEVTLVRLERILGGSDGATAYVRAVRERRYRGGRGPTAAERRALRRQLGAGLGLGGRLRAWWALPPRLGVPSP